VSASLKAATLRLAVGSLTEKWPWEVTSAVLGLGPEGRGSGALREMACVCVCVGGIRRGLGCHT
jgi:hypothetical protein